MGKKGVEILTLDVKSLIDVLNQALAEEWLAYYQYWVGARVMKGPMHDDIEKELLKHAEVRFRAGCDSPLAVQPATTPKEC